MMHTVPLFVLDCGIRLICLLYDSDLHTSGGGLARGRIPRIGSNEEPNKAESFSFVSEWFARSYSVETTGMSLQMRISWT
jgi:hypothetical protein